VQAQGARVVFECPKPLVPLLSRCPGIDHLVPQGAALPEFDVQAPLLSLPGLLGTDTPEATPAELPYLFPDPGLAERWRRRLQKGDGTPPIQESRPLFEGFKIGIAWQGSQKYKGDRQRSIPLKHFTVLAEVPGVRFYSLQKGHGSEQLKEVAGVFPVEDLGPELDEKTGAFMDTAAVVGQLDLVITCDTALSHLAGALGAAVWLALPFAADWRRLLRRDDCPWYPGTRLFRQDRPGRWDLVFARMADELKRLVSLSAEEQARAGPPGAESLNSRAIKLVNEGRADDAAMYFRRALRQRPRFPEALNNLGVVLAGQRKLARAVVVLQEALRLRPGYADALGNLGLALLDQGRPADAEVKFRQLVQARPDNPQTHVNLGVALLRQGRVDEAAAAYQEAIRHKPAYAEAHENLARAWLALGRWREAWPEYEWRWKAKDAAPRRFRQPRWDGDDLGGRTVLVYAEQGLGDTIQFVRYAALVRDRGGHVVLECPPPLVPLLSGSPGVEHVVGRGTPLPDFDVQVPLLSLPGLLGTYTPECVPAAVPYLSTDPRQGGRWRERLAADPAFKVGIAWQGNPKYTGDRFRSIPLAYFARLAEVPGVHVYSLQKGPGTEQLAALPRRFAIEDLGSQLDEGTGAFVQTAAVVSRLDLVITSDTALAHLAGALGVPVWVALPFAADWRWLLHRPDSPWYPSMRLFRQDRPGAWDSVFVRIVEQLTRRDLSCAGRCEELTPRR
jgi:tetratricopeptide (TPR) repeat protein